MKKNLFLLATVFLGLLIILVLTAPWILPADSFEQNVEAILRSPDSRYWMGTDTLGRDLFARILMGGRVSLIVGVVTSVCTLVLGFIYGALAGWKEGWLDRVLMRGNDIFMSIPSFVLVSVLCLTLQMLLPFEEPQTRAVVGLCIAISLTHWAGIARVTRGMVWEIRHKPYIEAAVAIGASPGHILFKHVLPNIGNTLLVLLALQIPANILYESFMSFIGLGIQPPYTSWGILVREGWKTLSSFPHLILFPSAILFLTVWSFHMVLDSFKK